MAYQLNPIQSTGQMLNFVGNNVSGSAAGTTLLTVPVSINVFGNNTNLLGTPAGWVNISISGFPYKLPYYN